jgi:hypothetical protein
MKCSKRAHFNCNVPLFCFPPHSSLLPIMIKVLNPSSIVSLFTAEALTGQPALFFSVLLSYLLCSALLSALFCSGQ